ncbi:MAG: cytochrome-c oxidase, cbb3-type subunit III [Alphaproteobacteria bacterium]|nr:cytochrome-c oxidase, cbb3-type subunit III [Alphaproteobacteria bacterium]
MAEKKDIDPVSQVETTGHEWDGIKELNNPLPKWWLYTFYACIAFAAAYSVYYPAIPLIEGATTGIGGYSSRAELQAELTELSASRSGLVERIASLEVSEIQKDGELRRFAIAGGESAFKVYCSQCHGSGAQGAPGYPNLNDDAWIWGGSTEQIRATIAHGVRYEDDPDTRWSEMPAFGRDGLLSRDQIVAVTQYVLSLSDGATDPTVVEDGATVYAENCAACHGNRALGDRQIGAPNLRDAIWLYGGGADDIYAQIQQPKHGVMPGWQSRLGDVTVKQLTLYIHSLGGGE